MAAVIFFSKEANNFVTFYRKGDTKLSAASSP